jgi:predicted transcriptional regulator
MQTQLPLFPENTRLINNTVGVFQKDEMMIYLHNGEPLFCHHIQNRNSYRYITANLVETGLCKPSEIAKVFGVSSRSVQLNSKNLRVKGADYFFNRVENRGKCFKLNEDSFKQAQSMIDNDIPISKIAKELEVTDAALRHHLRNGKLKKKIRPLKVLNLLPL